MASKTHDVRPKITLACTECKERNYITKKNRRNDPDRWSWRSSARAAASTPRTARPADRASRGRPRRRPHCQDVLRRTLSGCAGSVRGRRAMG